MENYKNKKILDICCGARMCWFDKENPNVIFNDLRKEKHKLCDGRIFEINPNTRMDFRKLKFKNNTFRLILFDPPHLLKIGKKSWMAKKYGMLKENWEEDLGKGFQECWRVLKKEGILIFKWNERDIKVNELIKIFGKQPLFGHTTGRSGKTKWMCFMKI